MQRALDETERRRDRQLRYNEVHGITPRGIVKRVTDIMDVGEGMRTGRGRKRFERGTAGREDYSKLDARQLNARLKKLENDMYEHARNLEFEEAARLRDEIAEIKESYFKTSDLEIA